MSKAGETFFTVVGCMDGRVQDVMSKYGQEKFEAVYPDTITEAGIVGQISNTPTEDFLERLKLKLLVSIDKHHSRGILVDGHAGCAGNPVEDTKHIKDIKESVKVIESLIGHRVPVIGVFVTRGKSSWVVKEV